MSKIEIVNDKLIKIYGSDNPRGEFYFSFLCIDKIIKFSADNLNIDNDKDRTAIYEITIFEPLNEHDLSYEDKQEYDQDLATLIKAFGGDNTLEQSYAEANKELEEESEEILKKGCTCDDGSNVPVAKKECKHEWAEREITRGFHISSERYCKKCGLINLIPV